LEQDVSVRRSAITHSIKLVQLHQAVQLSANIAKNTNILIYHSKSMNQKSQQKSVHKIETFKISV